MNALFAKLLKKKIAILVFLFLLNFLFSFPNLFFPMDTEADAYARVQVAYSDSYKNERTFTLNGSIWLPFHVTFLSICFNLFGNIQFSTRLLTLFFSSLVPFLIFLLTEKLTKDKLASSITAILFIFYPLFHHIGSTTLTEPLFLYLFLLSNLFFLKKQLWLFLFFLNLSHATRFESWFAIPWFSILILYDKKISHFYKLLIIISVCFFPLVYSFKSYLISQDLFIYTKPLSTAVAELPEPLPGHNNFAEAIKNWNQLINEFTPITFFTLLLVGVKKISCRFFNHQTNINYQFVFLVLPLFLFFMLYFQLYVGMRDWLPIRYLLIPTTLSFPLLGLGIVQIIEHRQLAFKNWAVFLLLAIFFITELLSQYSTVNRRISEFKDNSFVDLVSTCNFLKQIKFSVPKIFVYCGQNFCPPLEIWSFFLDNYLIEVKKIVIEDQKIITYNSDDSIFIIQNQLIGQIKTSSHLPIFHNNFYTVHSPND